MRDPSTTHGTVITHFCVARRQGVNIILPSTSWSPQWLFPSVFPTNTLCTPLSTPICTTFPAHLICLDFTTRSILGKEYRSFGVLGILINEGIKLRKREKTGLFNFFHSLHYPNNHFENISVFYLPLFNSVPKKKTILR